MQASDFGDLTAQISLTPMQALGIPIALVGAVFLSIGTQLQHRGVGTVRAGEQRSEIEQEGARMSPRDVLQLLRRPSWVVGTAMLGLAVLLQLGALALAPLIVVQPLGAIALVITAMLNARLSRTKLDGGTIRSIAYCLAGIAVFVTVAAFYAVEHPIDDRQLLTVLALLLVVLVGIGLAWLKWRDHANAVFYIIAAGVLYGFLVTLVKVVINRVVTDRFDALAWLCLLGVVVALAAGGYFVQLAHASGPPDLVIAGLTVVDPLIAVLIGVIVLGEARDTPVWALLVFVAAGALAIFGVFQLAKHHPQLNKASS